MFVECGAVSASSWIVRWPGCGACWLPAAARARDELKGLVASASSWLLLVGSLKASDCASLSLDFLKCLKLEW